MVLTSAILLIGRRQGGDEAALAASAEGSPPPLVISCSVLDVTSLSCSDMSSIFTTGGGVSTLGREADGGGGGVGDLGLAATAGGGAGAGALSEAPAFLGVGSGVAGVVETIGMTGGTEGCSSLPGGGGIIP